MVAPVVIRNFDAVEIANGHWTFYLNRQRLMDAIKFLSERPSVKSAAQRMSEKYPVMSPFETHNYMLAAQACIDYDVKP